MSSVFTMRHLAPVMLVPRRGRAPKLAHASLRTPVSPVEVTAAEIPKVGRLGDGTQVHAHAGSLWVPVDAPDVGSFLARVPPCIPAGATDRLGLSDLLVARSPAAALLGDAHPSAPDSAIEGARIILDGRERARTDLAVYLDGNLRACRGVAYLRIRGPMVTLQDESHGKVWRFDMAPFARDGATLHVSPSRAPAAWLAGTPGMEAPPVVGLNGLDHRETDEDVALYLCRAVERVAQAARSRVLHSRQGPDAKSLAERALDLAGAETLASLGALRAEDGPALMERVRALGEAVLASHRRERVSPPAGVARILALADTVFWPAASPTAEDEEAMEGLSPSVVA